MPALASRIPSSPHCWFSRLQSPLFASCSVSQPPSQALNSPSVFRVPPRSRVQVPFNGVNLLRPCHAVNKDLTRTAIRILVPDTLKRELRTVRNRPNGVCSSGFSLSATPVSGQMRTTRRPGLQGCSYEGANADGARSRARESVVFPRRLRPRTHVRGYAPPSLAIAVWRRTGPY